jgi:preprotein translocase subunit SecE
MATKMAIESVESGFGGIGGTWNRFTQFLTDVRSEMRKVVTPSREEVKVTTTVVVVTVFVFGVYFMVADWVFRVGVDRLLNKLGGMQ